MRSRNVALLLLAGACQLDPAFDRNNPFDPRSPYQMTMVDVPESVDVVGTRFTARIERDPPMPSGPLLISWSSSNSALVTSLYGGEYVVTSVPSTYVPVTLIARFNEDVVITRVVYVGRLPPAVFAGSALPELMP
jgi:hypothetical protein